MRKILIKGKELDLDAALPLTLGDIKKLKALGVKGGEINPTDPDHISFTLFILATKLDPSITIEDIDALSVDELKQVGGAIQEGQNTVDRPT